MTASLYALKTRIMSLTYIGFSCENNTVRNHNYFFNGHTFLPFGNVTSLLPPRSGVYSPPLGTWLDLWLWLVGYGGSDVVQVLEFKPQEALSPWNAVSEEAWDGRSRGERGPAAPATPAELRPQGTHGLNVATWMSPGKISRRTTQATESWKTINHCCFQPLNFEVVDYTAIDNYACFVIFN